MFNVVIIMFVKLTHITHNVVLLNWIPQSTVLVQFFAVRTCSIFKAYFFINFVSGKSKIFLFRSEL